MYSQPSPWVRNRPGLASSNSTGFASESFAKYSNWNESETLDRFAVIRQGIGTDRYTSQRLVLRHWELRPSWIGRRFKFFGKCDDRRWYGAQLDFLNWSDEAVAYLETHATEKAVQMLKRSLELNPAQSEIRSLLKKYVSP